MTQQSNFALLKHTELKFLSSIAGKLETLTMTNKEVLIDQGLTTPEGMAIDWVAGLIYFIESSLDQMEVSHLDGSERTVLIAGNMYRPRSIALDPREGFG